MAFEQRTGWRVYESGAGDPPSLNIVDLLMQERREPAPVDPPSRGTWFEVTINQLVIFADRFRVLPLGRWTQTYTIRSPRNASGGSAHIQPVERLIAEQRALEAMSKEQLPEKDYEQLLQNRKREFDAAWGIDPASPTNHRPIELDKT